MNHTGKDTHKFSTSWFLESFTVDAAVLKDTKLSLNDSSDNTPIAQAQWSKEDQDLINWVLAYIDTMTTTHEAYKIFEQEIALGPHSPRARTGELQKGFKLMKSLVETGGNT